MSVKLLDNDSFYGFRVRRTVNGKLYQEYFSLKANGKRVSAAERKRIEQEARTRDAELADEQQRLRQHMKADRCFNSDGSVKGVSYLLKTEKSGALTPIFQIGIASELEDKVVCTSFSINAHGEDNAWSKAIEAYAKHKLIRKNTKLYKRLMKSKPKVG